jgi:hypothetical protein
MSKWRVLQTFKSRCCFAFGSESSDVIKELSLRWSTLFCWCRDILWPFERFFPFRMVTPRRRSAITTEQKLIAYLTADTLHLHQPLDVVSWGTWLNSYHSEVLEKWLQDWSGQCVTLVHAEISFDLSTWKSSYCENSYHSFTAYRGMAGKEKTSILYSTE